ncbi:MAG TPA: ATP-binding protein [Actinomycetota bacterium]|nr:ATP-binding protein [Actinomycetota bacterium]
MAPPAGRILASVPARTEYVTVLRSVAASVAARLDLSYDELEDLRLLVDEACARLLADGGGRTLTLELRLEGTGVAIEAGTEGAPSGWPPRDPAHALSTRILSALAEDVRFEVAGDRRVIRMRFRPRRVAS